MQNVTSIVIYSCLGLGVVTREVHRQEHRYVFIYKGYMFVTRLKFKCTKSRTHPDSNFITSAAELSSKFTEKFHKNVLCTFNKLDI